MLVPSCCDKSGTICYHLSPCYKVDDGNRLAIQVVPTRLIQAVRITTCYVQTNISLVETTCYESVGLINLVTR